MASGKMVSKKEKVYKLAYLAINMTANGVTIKEMEKES